MKKGTKQLASCGAVTLAVVGIGLGVFHLNHSDSVHADDVVAEEIVELSPAMICNMTIENADGTVIETVVPYAEPSLDPKEYTSSSITSAVDPMDSSILYNREITENTDGSVTYKYTKSNNTSNNMEHAEELYTTTCPKGIELDKEVKEKYDKLFNCNE